MEVGNIFEKTIYLLGVYFLRKNSKGNSNKQNKKDIFFSRIKHNSILHFISIGIVSIYIHSLSIHILHSSSLCFIINYTRLREFNCY